MILAINSTTIALELLARPMVPIFPKTMWMVITMFIYYVCLLMTEKYGKTHGKLGYKSMGKIFVIMVGYTVLMLFAGYNQLIGAIVTVVFIYLIFFMFLQRHNVHLKEMKVGGYIE